MNSHHPPSPTLHVPVMLPEMLHYLSPRKDGIYVDGTFGAGGYSRAILQQHGYVYGIDQDPRAEKIANDLKKDYPDHFTFVPGRFSAMKELLRAHQVHQVDGIALDLGVSSLQLDDPARGFSFRFEGPLDMRMSQKGLTAAEVVNTFPEKDLAQIIDHYGEERFARRIARKIVEARAQRPFTTTTELATVVRQGVRIQKSSGGIDPATRTFQALRIFINQELEELAQALEASEDLLAPGGRLVVIAFHSLEDRKVKEFMRRKSEKKERGRSRYLPDLLDQSQHSTFSAPYAPPVPAFTLVQRKAVKPTPEECHRNPRARSARLRVCEKRKEGGPHS